jgi:predicted membrane chloride channel (bestrophin family)
MKIPKKIWPAILIINSFMALAYFWVGWFLLSSHAAQQFIHGPYNVILGGVFVFYGFFRAYRAYAKYNEIKNG